MNLQQILSHRDACFICQDKLTYSITEHPNLVFLTDDKGFHIRSGHKQGIRMDFNFDGSYRRNKRHYKIYQELLTIRKACPNCSGIASNTTNNITLNNLWSKEYNYSFRLDQQKDHYSAILTYENARHYNDEHFYHIYNNHYAGTSFLSHSSFDKKVEDILNLRLPSPINLSNVNNIEEYVKKCKTIINFS